jgi:hypothetical protein
MMTDYRAGSDGGNPAPERRSPKGAAAMGAVAPVLAIANIVVMVGLSLSSYPLDEVLHYVRFEPAGPALALFGVIPRPAALAWGCCCRWVGSWQWTGHRFR